ncbi:MAG: SpvB/TcaC N-terminal domain-containing protein [Leptothrix sp. (in: b-proteobacteria)]
MSLPKGGGAIKGMGEKFAANPVTGTGSMSVPIGLSPGRGGFGLQLAVSYDSGAGQGVFGLGWQMASPSISRKTDKGLPRYLDDEESDTFLLSGAEDLVPVLAADRRAFESTTLAGQQYRVHLYRPRVEGLFARIERWSDVDHPDNSFWRSISRDNVTTWYGRDANSRIHDPDDPIRIFQWLISFTHDDKGNVVFYSYVDDQGVQIDRGAVWEANRRLEVAFTNRSLKRVHYGNVKPYLPKLGAVDPDPPPTNWLFEAVFDYGDHTAPFPTPQPDTLAVGQAWPARSDAYSSHRAGFEIRTSRLCQRVLMFHHFPDAVGVGANCLVRSTDFSYDLADTTADPLEPGYTRLSSVTQRSYQRKPEQTPPADVPLPYDYEVRALPPVTFTYSDPVIDSTIHTIAPAELENLPVGTQGPGYRWVDLDGEGLSGVLAEQAGGWYYKTNLGDGRFGALRAVSPQPAMTMAAGSRHQFMDLAGNGEIDVVDFAGSTPGFHERDRDSGWKRHVPFASLPNINWQDPNLRFVDLTGDGHADALITEQDVFTWYPSLDERGFGPAERTRQPWDENLGPTLVFADSTQSIFLADMCGDGLTDLVRIRNGEVCYWPNQGYGRFGGKVTLGNSPVFDHPDLFDPNRIRLTDIDGSGPVDLIYLGRDGSRLYFNRSGNSLTKPYVVDLPVATENLGAVQAADLLGNGTACLVWNSHLPADTLRPVCYIDLMGGKRDEPVAEHRHHEKPHLLTRIDNQLGASTEIEYTPSTRYYLQDQLAGTPWITRLPFPVHCVSRVTVRDKWRGTAFSSSYSYHHGYFDGTEREFRGFGRVEQIDTEDFGHFAGSNVGSPWITADQQLYQPPVKSVTWYHTGAALDRQRILDQFAQEYFPQRYAERLAKPAAGTQAYFERPLPEPELPADLDGDEWREALRACKGMVLRQESYELGVDKATGVINADTPVRLYSSATHNCHIQCLQPRGRQNRHAVFLVTESEALTYHYELALDGTDPLQPDPRIAHTINLRHDEYGNVQQAVAIGYPRWQPGDLDAAIPRQDLIHAVQNELHIAYTETRHTTDAICRANQNALDAQPDPTTPVRHHRLRLPCVVRTYELKGIDRADRKYYEPADFRAYELSDFYLHPAGADPAPLAVESKEYHQYADGSAAQKRIVEHGRSLYFDDFSAAASPAKHLPFGELGPRGLKYEDYKLALTDALLTAVFADRLDWQVSAGVPARTLLDTASVSGYVRGIEIAPGLTGQYWMRSGIAGFAEDAYDHFFLPERYTDPFGNSTTVAYDPLDLFVCSSEDAKGNVSGIDVDDDGRLRFDYRVLAPIEMVDANGNHSEVAFDIRSLVVAAAAKGKKIGDTWQGDHLKGVTPAWLNPSPQEVASYCLATTADRQQAANWLGTASTRFIYHFGEAYPAPDQPQWCDRMAGACGFVREIHTSQPGGDTSPLQIALECSDGGGNVLMKKAQAEPDPTTGQTRWIVNGLTLLNNKGKPVRQFEPAFTPDFGCELPTENGVSSTTFYDAAGRAVRVEMPDGTFSYVEFSPWFSRSFDANDTVMGSNWYKQIASIAPASRLPTDAAGTYTVNPDVRAAWLTAQHADTPAQTHFDSLGREVVAIAHLRVEDTDGKHKFDGRSWRDAYYLTFTKLDAEGKPLWIRDARGNLVMQYIKPPKPTCLADQPTEDLPSQPGAAGADPVYSAPCYDIAGNLLFQHSMDAGDRWMLTDAAGKPMLAWDANDRGAGTPVQQRLFRTDYDALHCPVAQWLKLNDAEPALIEAFDHCDWSGPNGATDLADAQSRNLIGQAVRHWDPSGLATVERIDLCGKPAHVTRTLIKPDADTAGSGVIDWGADRAALLDNETFEQRTEYDALGRMTRLFNWHRGTGSRVAVYEPKYNERSMLQSEDLVVRASKTNIGKGYTEPAESKRAAAITGITYNAKGQKETLELGNGTTTTYEYDPQTYRLLTLKTRRTAGQTLQNLSYTYDPVGNITQTDDKAQDTVWANNSVIRPEHHYTYDAIYRLIEATGRENSQAPSPAPRADGPWPQGVFPTGDIPRNYTQRYVYDEVGNFIKMTHMPPQAFTGWTRFYQTANDSNRLLRTWYGDFEWSSSKATEKTEYRYDIHGSMLNLNDVPENWGRDIIWDWRDMIRSFDAMGGGTATYHYGIDKQRTRKHIVRIGGYAEDRIYLGGYELYRGRNAVGNTLEEMETLHLIEGEQRILLVDDVLLEKSFARPWRNNAVYKESILFRFQYGNHLGSVGVELDEAAQIISYEEFHPYGTCAFRLMNSELEVPAKKYLYAGMEKDEESGLSYHAARFNIVTLGRWISCDSEPEWDHFNAYASVRCNPMLFVDTNGKWAELGHYYTVLLTSLAVGKDLDSSLKLAFYAQLPDEVANTDAVANAPMSILSNLVGGSDKGTPRAVQVGLHALTGMGSADETSFRRERVQKSDYDFELGAALHAFGDSYSHRRLDDESKMYSPGVGHGGDKTHPDEVACRPKLFKEYAIDLYETLSKRLGNRTARLSREQFEKIIVKVAADATETAQIKTLIEELRKSMPDVAKDLDRSEASPFLGDRIFRPEKSDFIPLLTGNLILDKGQSLLISEKDASRANEQMRQKLTPLQQRIVGFDGLTNLPSAYESLAAEWTKARSEFRPGK